MNFDKVLLFTAESNVQITGNDPLDGILVADTTTSFLAQVMNYNSEAIQQDLNNAIIFFRNEFGIDFTSAPRSNGAWKLDTAWLIPYYIVESFNYNQIYPTPAKVRSGGWMVQIVNPGYVGSASFNTKNSSPEYPKQGKVLFKQQTSLFFGYYKVMTNDRNNKIYHYRSSIPHVTTFGSPLPPHMDVWDPDLSLWGKADTVSDIVENGDGTAHLSARTVLTVPGRL